MWIPHIPPGPEKGATAVELDHVKTGQPFTEAAARAFIEGIIFPTLGRAEQLAQEGRIVAGGPAITYLTNQTGGRIIGP